MSSGRYMIRLNSQQMNACTSLTVLYLVLSESVSLSIMASFCSNQLALWSNLGIQPCQLMLIEFLHKQCDVLRQVHDKAQATANEYRFPHLTILVEATKTFYTFERWTMIRDIKWGNKECVAVNIYNFPWVNCVQPAIWAYTWPIEWFVLM